MYEFAIHNHWHAMKRKILVRTLMRNSECTVASVTYVAHKKPPQKYREFEKLADRRLKSPLYSPSQVLLKTKKTQIWDSLSAIYRNHFPTNLLRKVYFSVRMCRILSLLS
jgi:hypothetical protein